MHVGLYASSWPPGKTASGVVTYVVELKRALEALGHRVTVFSTPGRAPLATRMWRRLKRLGRPEQPFDLITDGGRLVAAAALEVHRRDPLDIIEMEESFGWSLAVQAATGVPVVVRLHGPHFLGKDAHETPADAAETLKRELAEGEAIRNADGLTSPSDRLLSATLDHYTLPQRGGLANFNPMHSAAEAELWQLGRSDPALILCVGRFDWRKGADIVLQAFARVVAAVPTAELAFVGPESGLQLNAGELLGFEDYCRCSLPADVAARIRFLGRLQPEAISSLRLQARITVVGSRFETFSYAATEAMALGCPLVGTDIFGVGEVIVDGESGWLVPPEDPRALADAMLAALADEAECVRRGRLAWQRASAAFDPATIAAQTADYYAKVLARSARSSRTVEA